jgi:RNA polymerase sigma factor for flagellar operon FliA
VSSGNVSDDERSVLEALPVIDGVVREIGRRYQLSRDDQEEFAAAVRLRMLEGDRAVLRKYQGRSRLGTYLRVVITRWFLDDRIKAWGRWRPSADAVRLGPTAVALERLLERQRLSLDEAIETLRGRQADVDERALRDLATALPRRVSGRRLVDDAGLAAIPTPGPGSDHLVHEAQASALGRRVAAALRAAVEAMPPRERLLLRLRFEQGATVADISRVLQEPQKPLYRELERLLQTLRREIEAREISPADVRRLLEHPAAIDGTAGTALREKMPVPSVSVHGRPDGLGPVTG